MTRLILSAATFVVLACVPGALPLAIAGTVVYRWRRHKREQRRISVLVREAHTRRVTLTHFVPRQSSWWGRA